MFGSGGDNLKTFNKNLPRTESIGNFKIKRSGVWFSIGLFYVNPGIYFDMLKEKCDVIHTIGVRSFQSYAAALVSKKRNIPLIISDQGGLTTHPDLKNSGLVRQIFYKLQSPMIQFVIGQSKKIIVANEYEKKIFSELTDENKIEIKDVVELNDKSYVENSLVDLNNAFTNKYYKIVVKEDYALKKRLIIYHTTKVSLHFKNINFIFNRVFKK